MHAVAVVIPAHQAERSLFEALGSVHAQTLAPAEGVALAQSYLDVVRGALARRRS